MSRASLSDRFTKKPVDEQPSTKVAAIPEVKEKDNRVQILVRMLPEERQKLRMIALEQSTTVQALVESSIRDILKRNGRV